MPSQALFVRPIVRKTDPAPLRLGKLHPKGYRAKVGGKRFWLGRDEQQAKELLAVIAAEWALIERAASGGVGAGVGAAGAISGADARWSRNRFKKQKNEYSLLLPGDRAQRQVVRVIFYLRYKRGWRGWRIADYLNRNRIPAPRGGTWSPRQVESIYENEAYTGVTFNDQTYSGRFFKRDQELGFVALNRDETELVLKKTFTPKLRPMDEWQRIDQPHMYDFLPRDVRDLAIAAQAELWRSGVIRPARADRSTRILPVSSCSVTNSAPFRTARRWSERSAVRRATRSHTIGIAGASAGCSKAVSTTT